MSNALISVAKKVPILHLMCGLPGSGKSTIARRLEEDLNAVRLSPDEWLIRLGIDFYDGSMREKVEDLQWHLARQLLKNGNDVILENGFWSRAERDKYRTTAKTIGAATKIHFLDVPVSELKRRLSERNESGYSPRVDPSSLNAWANLLESPDAEELR